LQGAVDEAIDPPKIAQGIIKAIVAGSCTTVEEAIDSHKIGRLELMVSSGGR
jgi:hypothetical protein